MKLDRTTMVLCLFQHYIDTCINSRTGDLDLRFVPPYDKNTIEAVVTRIAKAGELRVNHHYMGSGGYTKAYDRAKREIRKFFPGGLIE